MCEETWDDAKLIHVHVKVVEGAEGLCQWLLFGTLSVDPPVQELVLQLLNHQFEDR